MTGVRCAVWDTGGRDLNRGSWAKQDLGAADEASSSTRYFYSTVQQGHRQKIHGPVGPFRNQHLFITIENPAVSLLSRGCHLLRLRKYWNVLYYVHVCEEDWARGQGEGVLTCLPG